MKKSWLLALFALCFLSILTPAFGDEDDSTGTSSSDDSSSSSSSSPSTPDELTRRGTNDLVFDSADESAPFFSKSNETYRAPASLATRDKSGLGQ